MRYTRPRSEQLARRPAKPRRLIQLAAQIHLGTRTVLEYLLSPVQQVAHEAGREK